MADSTAAMVAQMVVRMGAQKVVLMVVTRECNWVDSMDPLWVGLTGNRKVGMRAAGSVPP
jgi:hypothetical protein